MGRNARHISNVVPYHSAHPSLDFFELEYIPLSVSCDLVQDDEVLNPVFQGYVCVKLCLHSVKTRFPAFALPIVLNPL